MIPGNQLAKGDSIPNYPRSSGGGPVGDGEAAKPPTNGDFSAVELNSAKSQFTTNV